MTKFHYTLAFLILTSGVTLLYGYKVTSKGQQKEAITAINGKSTVEKDKENSKRFTKYKTGQKLTDPAFLEQQSNEIVVTKAPSIIDIPLERKCPTYPLPALVGLAYASDAIVIGTIKEKITSQLTEDEDFLFSEYGVVVEDVIKNNPNAPITLGSAISVIRPGGKVKLNDKIINAVVHSFRPFLEGDRYLLYLKYIPETHSYQAFTNASFLIEGEVVKTPKMRLTEHNKQAFITEVRDAVLGDHCQRVVLN